MNSTELKSIDAIILELEELFDIDFPHDADYYDRGQEVLSALKDIRSRANGKRAGFNDASFWKNDDVSAKNIFLSPVE